MLNAKCGTIKSHPAYRRVNHRYCGRALPTPNEKAVLSQNSECFQSE